VTRFLRHAAGAWDRYFFTPATPHDLGLSRAIFYTLAFLYYLPQDFGEWGTVAPEFRMPIALFRVLSLPLLPAGPINAIELLFKVSLALAAIGLFTGAVMVVAFVCGLYLLGLPHNFGQVQHFDTLIVLVFGILAVSRAGDAWSIDAWRRRRRAGVTGTPRGASSEYNWPIRAIWVTTALVFFAAGFSKLRHSGLDWIFSDHLATLLIRHQYHVSDGDPLTAWGPAIAAYPWAARALAAVAIITEACYPLALFSRRARCVFVPAGLGFLIGIRLLMGPTFEAFVICSVFWVPWSSVRERVGVMLGRQASPRDRPCTSGQADVGAGAC
jgi:hypothetical protein